MAKVAVVQTSPVLLNREQTIQLAANLTDEAANQGAELVIFTEAFIPGYPVWMWRLRPGGIGGLPRKFTLDC
jgi:nitrilase